MQRSRTRSCTRSWRVLLQPPPRRPFCFFVNSNWYLYGKQHTGIHLYKDPSFPPNPGNHITTTENNINPAHHPPYSENNSSKPHKALYCPFKNSKCSCTLSLLSSRQDSEPSKPAATRGANLGGMKRAWQLRGLLRPATPQLLVISRQARSSQPVGRSRETRGSSSWFSGQALARPSLAIPTACCA
jgi:hypothetical protein